MVTAARPKRGITWIERRVSIRNEWRVAMRMHSLAWVCNARSGKAALAEFNLENAIRCRRMAEMYS